MYFIGWLRTRDGRTRRSGRASKGRVRRTSVQLQPLSWPPKFTQTRVFKHRCPVLCVYIFTYCAYICAYTNIYSISLYLYSANIRIYTVYCPTLPFFSRELWRNSTDETRRISHPTAPDPRTAQHTCGRRKHFDPAILSIENKTTGRSTNNKGYGRNKNLEKELSKVSDLEEGQQWTPFLSTRQLVYEQTAYYICAVAEHPGRPTCGSAVRESFLWLGNIFVLRFKTGITSLSMY